MVWASSEWVMLRPWVLRIILRRDSAASVHRQITHAIIEEIRAGRLAPGSALPGSRKLAETLKVNRKTVVQAYDELVAQSASRRIRPGPPSSRRNCQTLNRAFAPRVRPGRAARSRRSRIFACVGDRLRSPTCRAPMACWLSTTDRPIRG
jgi:DNA-binding transcriptional MocR family regulator